MNKEELKQAIQRLPEFEKRDVKVQKHPVEGTPEDYVLQQNKQAICETEGTQAVAFVSPAYKLVQFKEVFAPILDSITEDCTGGLISYGGFAMMKVFPENEAMKDENGGRYGIVCVNSVDLSSSIVVKFIVQHGNLHFTIPPGVAGLKKQHSGDVKSLVKDYLSMVGKVKDVWKHIVTEFPKHKIVRDIKTADPTPQLELRTVTQRLHLGVRLTKKLNEIYDKATATGQTYTLWSLVVDALHEVSGVTYRSEVHKEKNMNKICEAVFAFACTLNV